MRLRAQSRRDAEIHGIDYTMKTSYLSKVAIAVSALLVMGAQAAPMAQSEKDITGHFSVDTQLKFNLFADNQDAKLVWYVPKEGQVAISGATTATPRPRFSVLSRFNTSGFWAGQEQAVIGGAFDTTGNRGALLKLEAEAKAKGWRISPAPASKATTRFMLSDIYFSGQGRAQIQCENKDGIFNGIPFTVPECKVLDDDGQWVNTDVLTSFLTTSPTGLTSTSTYIPFQAVTNPNIVNEVRELMSSGSNWDAHIQATTQWELTTESKTQVARINIDWARTFEQASTFFAIHYNSCLEVEVQTFFRRLLDNQNGESGITIEYRQPDGTYSDNPTNIAQFDMAVQSLYQSVRDELFVELRDYGQSQIGRVNTEARAVFTMRANYEKLIFKRNETRYLTWNPGSKITNAQTNMTIQCVKGGFGLPVSWDMDDAACREIVGQ